MSSGQVLRRNLPGTKAADFCGWPDQSFEEMDSTLAVQQLIQQTIRNDYTDIAQILQSPDGQDEGVWKYEHLRVSIKDSSVAKLGSVCRRVYRIFSHAYYHHRHIFDEFENESHLCRRFTVFVIKYNLMSRDNLIVPILEEPALKTGNDKETPPTFTLATPAQKQEEDSAVELSADDNFISLALSSTVIEAQSEETSDDKDDFGGRDGTHDFSTLKINKSVDKAVEEDAKPPNGDNDSKGDAILNISINETLVAHNDDAPSSSETA